MRRFVGLLLMATGVLDLLANLVIYPGPLAAVARDGFFNAVEPDVAFSTFDREAAIWHVMFGVMFVVLGALVHWTQARTGTLPAFLGWLVLALGMAGVILMPLSGSWLLFPQAVLILAVAGHGRFRAAIAEAESGFSYPGDHTDQPGQARRT
jgi:hypothetical protein